MVNFYWVATTPGSLSSDFANWSSVGSGGAPLTAWPGTSPDTADSFIFDGGGTADCTWEVTLAPTMDDVESIQVETDSGNLYTGVITLDTDLQLRGLQLNCEITDGGNSKTITFTGTPLTSFNDTNSKKRYVLNGQKAKHGSTSTLTYKMSPGTTDVHLDNGPYNKLTIDTNPMTLAYNVPTTTTHDNADDGTIHIKGAFNAASTGGFARDTAPDASADTAVKIKFDNTSFTYSNSTLDFVLATAHFRGIEVPVTGSQTYGTSSAGFTAKHYGVVIFADSNGDLCTIPNGLQLDCYSFEVKAGARVRVASANANPATIKSQLQPIVKGVWSFQSLNSNVFVSPRNNPVTSVANGGTGLSSVESKALLMGNSSTPMQPLTAISPGTDGYVLTMVSGTPAWAASSGGGGGAVDSVFGRTGTVVATEGDYDLDELGDVDVTSAAETQILRHDGTSFVNEYNDIMFLRVKAREAINKGEAIYIFDAHNSDVVGVKKAKADSSTTMPCIGVAYENLALGDEGLAVSFGKANGIAANFTEGQTMYVSPTTAGALTNTKPTGTTQLIQNVGILMQAHASNAVVKVTGIGRSNDVPNQFSIGGSITASSFIKSGGASTEFLKADGSVDTNTYSTATGVEDNADVTDTANVTAAGALMDSEVTNLAAVKAFDPADYATAAQGTLADSALQEAADVDISGLTATTTIVDTDLLMVDDGANGTTRKSTFSTIKDWIRDNVSKLKIRDSRADGDVGPNGFADKSVSFDFTDDITGSTNAWDAVITMKGWSDNYRAYQIWSDASNSSRSVDETPLFFRSGEEDVQSGWGETKEILTFPGTAPRVDGLAGQVLQTDGAGTLSWENKSNAGVAKLDCIISDSVRPAGNWITIDFDGGNWQVNDPGNILILGPSGSPDQGKITIGSSSDELYMVILHLWLISTPAPGATGNGLWIVRGNYTSTQDGGVFYHREQEYTNNAQSAIVTPIQFTVAGGTTIDSIEYYYNLHSFQYRGNAIGTTRTTFVEVVRLK